MKTLIQVMRKSQGIVQKFEVDGDYRYLDGVAIGAGGSPEDFKLQNELLTLLNRSHPAFLTKDWDYCIRVEYL